MMLYLVDIFYLIVNNNFILTKDHFILSEFHKNVNINFAEVIKNSLYNYFY